MPAIEIYAVAANNDFSSPVPEHRESQLVYMRDLIRMTADLGAKTLRVFAAWPGCHDVGRRERPTSSRANSGARRTCDVDAATDLGVVPRRPGRGRAPGRRRRRDARAAESRAGHQQPGRHAADDSRRRIRRTSRPASMRRSRRSRASRRCATPRGPSAGLQVLSHFGGEYERAAGRHASRGFVRNPDFTLTPRRLLRGLRAGHAATSATRVHRLRAVPPAAEGERRAGRDRVRRQERPARRRIHARRDCVAATISAVTVS